MPVHSKTTASNPAVSINSTAAPYTSPVAPPKRLAAIETALIEVLGKLRAGKDVLLEHGGEGLYQPLDLEIARCRMVVATRRGFDWAGTVQRGARIRVATKYVKTAREHFAAKGMHVDLIKLYGSMELAPLAGLADAIVDLVSTGNTLRANSLRVVEEIMPVSSRLIVNQAALKTKRGALQPLIERFEAAVAAHA